MRPLPFDRINDFEAVRIAIPDGKEMKGLFTNLRIDRDTLPQGCFAYDIREDDDTVFSTVEPWVRVNHSGTIITRTAIPMLEGDGEDAYSPIEYLDTGNKLTAEDWRGRYLNP